MTMWRAMSQTFSLIRMDGLVISDRMEGAFSYLRRTQGLLFCAELAENRALWIRPGGGVHTFGMRFPIDVMFLDEHLVVLAVRTNVGPWRVRWAPRHTRSTVEIAAGRVERIGLKAGDELFVQPGEPNHV